MGSPQDFAGMLALFGDGLRPVVDRVFALDDAVARLRSVSPLRISSVKSSYASSSASGFRSSVPLGGGCCDRSVPGCATGIPSRGYRITGTFCVRRQLAARRHDRVRFRLRRAADPEIEPQLVAAVAAAAGRRARRGAQVLANEVLLEKRHVDLDAVRDPLVVGALGRERRGIAVRAVAAGVLVDDAVRDARFPAASCRASRKT